MSKRELLCFGCGYTAQRLAQRLLRDGWVVHGTTRDAGKTATLANTGIQPLVWDGGAFDPALLSGVDAVLISTPPGKQGCPVINAAGDAIAARANQFDWIGYLSTNGVYGDHDGEWVTEASELRPSSDRAWRRVTAESKWFTLAEETDLPLNIFRLPGIYGPGRSAIDAVREGRARRIYKHGQVFSRMHVDDIAQTLEKSLNRQTDFNLFNLADDEPSPPQEVIEFACLLLGEEPPPLTPLEEADLSAMARSFYTDNKRVSNARMKQALGVRLQYPSFREGLKAILKSETGGGA